MEWSCLRSDLRERAVDVRCLITRRTSYFSVQNYVSWLICGADRSSSTVKSICRRELQRLKTARDPILHWKVAKEAEVRSEHVEISGCHCDALFELRGFRETLLRRQLVRIGTSGSRNSGTSALPQAMRIKDPGGPRFFH